jgi:hypothetical protein
MRRGRVWDGWVYNSKENACLISTLREDLQLPTGLHDHAAEAHLPRANCRPALLPHLLHPQYLPFHPDFYLSSHLQVNTTQSVSFLYKYHIAISTDTSTYLYTNVATNYE